MSNEGGPAFPLNDQTLRDWFAGMALSGIKLRAKENFVAGVELDDAVKQIALGAYAVADALLRQRQ